MTNRIDIHNHLIPEEYVSLLATLGIKGTPAVDFPSWSPKKALKVMDRNGIRTAILSMSTPGTYFKDDAFSRKLTRVTNEYSAELIARYPGRFGAFAALPLPDEEGALAEIEYSLDTLGLDGVGLLTNYQGIYLGDPRFETIFTELNRREAVVFVHPHDHLVMEDRYAIMTPILERALETTRAVTNLLTSGTLARYPKIRFILAHGGGSVPFLAERIAAGAGLNGAARSDLDRTLCSPVDIDEGLNLLKRLHFDTAQPGQAHLWTVKEFAGVEHMLFGTDSGWVTPIDTRLTTRAVAAFNGFDEAERKMVDRDNARTLFPRFA
ncbi:MAG: amidohydrolase [Ignavibacteria bacterium]|nr:MAG: amidohydrolase [Ignavibacteria bacterium]